MGWLGKLFGGDRVVPTPVRTLDAFERIVLDSEVPVLVDVWSESCVPCRKLAPILVELATEYAGRLLVVEVSATSEPALLRELGVQATPTVLVYDGGEELGRVVGLKPKSWFREMIAAELPSV